VYWLDGESREILASSGMLKFAPVGIDMASGHGGSGTLGFEPDESFLPLSTVGDGSVSANVRIDPTPVVSGSNGRFTLDLLNAGGTTLFFSDLQILATPGSCASTPSERSDNQQSEAWVIAPPRDVAVEAGRRQRISESFGTTDVAVGTSWCARISALDSDDRRTRIGASASFRVVAPGSDAGIPPQDLGFYNPNNPGQRTRPDNLPDGCGCHQQDGSPMPAPVVLIGLLAGVIIRRQIA
jgi:hypothetical protein